MDNFAISTLLESDFKLYIEFSGKKQNEFQKRVNDCFSCSAARGYYFYVPARTKQFILAIEDSTAS